jgi:hypothetical protein
MDVKLTANAKEIVKELLFKQGINDFGIGVNQDGSNYIIRVFLYDSFTRPILPDNVNGIRVVIIRSSSPCFACD